MKNGAVISLAGGSAQFVNQLIAGFHGGVGVVGTFIIFKIVNGLVGMRVDQEDESAGLDLSQHGERAYNE